MSVSRVFRTWIAEAREEDHGRKFPLVLRSSPLARAAISGALCLPYLERQACRGQGLNGGAEATQSEPGDDMTEPNYPLQPRRGESRDRDWIALSILTTDGALFDQNTLRRICEQTELDHVIDEIGSLTELRVRLRAGRYDLILVDDAVLSGQGIAAISGLLDGSEVLIVVGHGLADDALSAAAGDPVDYIATEKLTPGRLRAAVSEALERRTKQIAEAARAADAALLFKNAFERGCGEFRTALETIDCLCADRLQPILDRMCESSEQIRTLMKGPE